LDGNYGAHGDNRNGTVSKDDPEFSRFMLTVPTLCLQNYAQETTRISWCPRSDTKWVAGTVWQFFCLIHIQLIAVQEFFLHHVSASSSACYFCRFEFQPLISSFPMFVLVILQIHTTSQSVDKSHYYSFELDVDDEPFEVIPEPLIVDDVLDAIVMPSPVNHTALPFPNDAVDVGVTIFHNANNGDDDAILNFE
jgi:hypothetical protein